MEIGIDVDLTAILECQGAKEQMAKENNISIEMLESIFNDALKKGITTINQLNDSIRNQND